MLTPGVSLKKANRLRLCTMLLSVAVAQGQDDYEIQVYPGDTVEAHNTMVEFHSNFTADGRKTIENRTLPTHHAFPETVEITHGVNDWFEVGWYIFTDAQSGSGWKWVGDHIRPRIRVPEHWHTTHLLREPIASFSPDASRGLLASADIGSLIGRLDPAAVYGHLSLSASANLAAAE